MTNHLPFPKPNDEYWCLVTYDNTHQLTPTELDNYYISLLPVEQRIYDIIHSINSIMSFNINIASKFMDLDEIVKCKVINKSNNEPNQELICAAVVGFSTFIRFPAGVINYHSINESLFQVSGIEFMMNKGSYPIEYIDEFFQKVDKSGKTCLFNTVRSSGNIQSCLVLSNSSIYYRSENENIDENTNNSWRISVCFNDHSSMNAQEIQQDNKNILCLNYGSLSKSVYLNTFMELNNIRQITLDKSRLRNDILNSFPLAFNKIPNFENIDGAPDLIYIKNIEYIQNMVVKYYLEKLDEYTNCLQKYLSDDGIKTIII